MNAPKIYLIGPMSGIPQFNYPAFVKAAEYLREQGFDVQSPTDLDDQATFDAAMASPDGRIDQPVNGFTYEDFLAKSIARILTWRPDMLVALPGWEDSSGAHKEALVAKALGIDVQLLEDYDPIVGFPGMDERAGLALYDAAGKFITHADNPLRQRAVTGAVKDNRGKPNVELLPSKPLLAVGRVLGVGARKYKPNNWRLGLSWTQTLGSALRHILAFADGEDIDPESGECHIDNALCQLLFLSEYWHTKTGEDDRWSSQPESRRQESAA